MTTKLDPREHSWMRDARTSAVMRALNEGGGAARFVGGAVRNALLHEPVGDIDIATALRPAEVTELLQRAGLGVAPTGIAHGTVTAIADGKPFEVTTLRRDVETDGRRAVVAFTTDWKEDAARRDFTMNALYADEFGSIFDYFDGIADLRAGHVRFVGDAAMRIREDFLRILRLFRFHAWYGKGEIDAQALSAAVAEKSGLKKLSGERVHKEVLRLLEAKDPVPVLRVMDENGILAEILPAGLHLERLQHLVAIDRTNRFVPDPLLRLAALLPSRTPTARNVAQSLRLSNADRDRLVAAVEPDSRIVASLGHKEVARLLYVQGPPAFSDQLLLSWAGDDRHETESQWRALLAFADRWQRPVFPLDGRDVKALGIAEGPKVGALLGHVEEWWIGQDFKGGRKALLARLKEAAKTA